MIALTHLPSPRLDQGVVTHLERRPIDLDAAERQHAEYRGMLERLGARVRVLAANLEHPDCVFIEDTAIVLDEVAVSCSMGVASRRAEPAGIEPVLREYRDVMRVESPATLEGGDVQRIGRTLLVGKTGRTNAAGIEWLRAIASEHGYELRAIDVDGCLHFKSACTVLPDGSLLVNPDWVATDHLAGFELVAVPGSEPFAADVLTIGASVLVEAAHERTAALLRGRSFDVHTIDLSEYAKIEGGVTCLSILIGDTPGAARP
jgi:dimethylargininase